jgi:dTDP-4-dehydrorhamnose reductase
MRIYILGISGMLGHKIFEEFSDKTNYNVRGSVQKSIPSKLKIYQKKIDINVSAQNLERINFLLQSFKPDYIINCIGYIKHHITKQTNLRDVYYLNSFFPYKIYEISNSISAKFIHFSTDCVYDGAKGNYKEIDLPNAVDAYGISKFLGESFREKFITVRTSIIGHELSSKIGLLEWFLNKKKSCIGYSKTYFSGLTTLEIFNFLHKLIKKNSNIKGLVHLSSKKISKYNLLTKIKKIYKKKINIVKNINFKSDRSLNSSYIKKKLSYKVPSWNQMIKRMYLNYLKNEKK